MHDISIKIVDSPEHAPDYKGTGAKAVQLKEVIVVGRGMESGRPTVDLILMGEDGQQYVAMVTGNLMEMVGGATQVKRIRDEQVDAAAKSETKH